MNDAAGSWLVHPLRGALQHLWDPIELRKNPLVELLALDQERDPVRALRSLLMEAIESLKPAPTVPSRSSAWRTFQILSHHFVEQLTQHEVASDLGLSIRQLQRHERLAFQALADHLATRHGLRRPEIHPTGVRPRTADDPTAGGGASTHEQELEWLQRSVPSGPTDLGDVLQSALGIVAPLARMLDVRLGERIPRDPVLMAAQPTAIRQALLIVLTVAIRYAPGGEVRIEVEAHRAGARVGVRAGWLATDASAATEPDLQPLEMARQLIALSGGALEVSADAAHSEPFAASLTLPLLDQVRVSVVDDNADTLELFDRYLAGSRYRFAGVSDPSRALDAVQESAAQIVVMDVMLPGIDGWELLGRLRAHPGTQHIPVVVCTILPQEQLALALGAAGFLSKPFSRQTLLSALDRQVEPLATERR